MVANSALHDWVPVVVYGGFTLAAVGSRLGLSALVVLSKAADPRRLVIDRTGAVVGTVLVCAGVGATLDLAARRTKGHTRFAIPMIISWIGVAVVLVESLFGLLGELVTGGPTC